MKEKFKRSPLTLFGLVSLIATPLGIALSSIPSFFQIFSLIPLGILGTSFWWYRIANAEEIAKEGALIYQDWHKEQMKEKRRAEFNEIELYNLKGGEKLKKDLWNSYQSFVHAIRDQEIISEELFYEFESKADQGFHSGVNLLKEIADLQVIQSKTSLSKLERQLSKADKENRAIIQKNIGIYNSNEQKISELTSVLQKLILSFQSSELNLASATSSFDSQNIVNRNSDELTLAVEASKQVQARLNRFSMSDEQNLKNLYQKYGEKHG